MFPIGYNTNFLLTEREGRGCWTDWSEFVAIRTERSEVHEKTSDDQYFPIRFVEAGLVHVPAFESQKKNK